ncbi:hypothetical protein [Croceimicrobium hydrocarbonivorans]|uniref:Uncharacterized protein n=1 Tax=Croceimicrobium hydrocarbonivorans TaxID=2761580 RepID=A0A7H0VB34_9FLAO|nr:hypothetical protein [Croceimicrobium hydrocarbonivorans]QNR22932.1 hypothetical protein H4K34_11140 [Croceimicrobium hydrocarbonivorans]
MNFFFLLWAPVFLYGQEGDEFFRLRDFIWDSVQVANALDFIQGRDDSIGLKSDSPFFRDGSDFKVGHVRVSLFRGGQYLYSVVSIGSHREKEIDELYQMCEKGDSLLIEDITVYYKRERAFKIGESLSVVLR